MDKQFSAYTYFFFLVISSILFVNCAKIDNSPNIEITDPEEQLREDKALIESFLTSQNLPVQEDASGVYFRVDEIGRGGAIENFGSYNVLLEGYFLEETGRGETFDRTAECSPVTVNMTQLITGFRSGLQLFTIGGKGSIYLPSALAFGQEGVGSIPPNTVLAFDVEVVDQNLFDRNKIKQYLSENNISADSTLSGIFYRIDNLGTGDHPTINSTVTVNYRGYYTDGTEFDRSNNPVTFELTNVIQGWQEVVPLLKSNGSGTFLIPSKFGYGPAGNASIPGNTMLIFDIELIEFRD